ncbi:type I phosphodiesterase/nucleotide pyrophosphatase [Emticicia oligotrophica DSM 17448]|uniref:Type I phosphodiesterase/nucleotide pyrophosphatase n=1 Tax=Emticicia oligotrophica (strain DSM 17448 / CIP 109782 / MTCC 6937 / GPTSA100-15) TaxID=929562 RepID=A0ABM5N372_EMTOG|nr:MULTISPECIES: alkaline phosphatase PafA [Emticicia]AFK03907.1 type I phosphodiesterase/nucleotide pyrophosphatase [Emticicia oligotrophica DSM 17448]
MKRLIFLLFLIGFGASAQKKETPTTSKKPKLVLGIMVDQMRYDYLYRYYDKYTEGGFKRLMNEGFNCKNNHYHYANTITGPGHAAVYTGSVPAVNGIIGNEWYDPLANRSVYVAEDTTVKAVGTEASAVEGKRSPVNMHTTTITDQLKIATEFRSKVIGIAIKDRGGILPAGHSADAAYWFDAKSGNWISSTYYMNELPKWVQDFNAQKWPDKLIAQKWTTLLPIKEYTESEEDDQEYENVLSGEKSPVFPHSLANISALLTSAYGNTLTKEMTLATLKNEKMGQSKETDFLCVSFSTPDYVGHATGTHSIEIEDTYLRLDRDIAEVLKNLDMTLGKGNYTVFLTADHGVADVAGFLKKHKIPSGIVELSKEINYLNGEMVAKFGEGKWIKAQDNYQLYLDKDLMKKKNVSMAQVYELVKEKMLILGSSVYQVVNMHDIASATIPPYYKPLIENVYNPKRSGDIMILFEPAWYSGYKKGTTHGTMWQYDRHVPLLWYGWGVQQGETVEQTYIADISATLAAMLNILEPNGCVGQPIKEVIKKK